MKSRISFCDSTVLKKNLTRFAPAWVLYSVMWLLILIMMLDSEGTGLWFADSMSESLQFTTVMNMAYAFLCAQLLFGDLYNSRMCNALHAMPLRRETWFCTHVISGLLFSLIPNLGVMLLSSLFMGEGMIMAPMWLLVVTLQYLFFFGVAVFSAYSVGNRFAMALVYIIINGFSMIAYWLLESLYAPQLYGIRIDETPFTWFCPLFYMISTPAVNFKFSAAGTMVVNGPYLLPDTGFWYILLCAAVGIGFLVLALLLYRKRNLECAGDFVAVKAFAPVFLVLYCLCGGAVGYLFFSLFMGDESMFFLLVGMLIGWFTGKMLLERTVRIFRMKNFIGCGILLLAFFGSLLLTHIDPLGITRWMPRANAVSGVHIYTGGSRYDYYKEGSNYVDSDDDIETILALHRYGINHRDADYDGEVDVALTIDYKMKSGVTTSRYYTVNVNTPEGQALKKIMSRPQVVLGAEVTDAKSFAETLILMRCEDDDLITGDTMVGLIEAILMDCAEGSMAQDWNFHSQESEAVWLTMQLKSDTAYHQYRDVRVFESCTHTMDYLRQHDLLPEYYGK